MSTELESVLNAALRLPEAEREELADRLLESLDEVEAEWDEEIRGRLDDIRSGRVTPIPAAAARKLFLSDDGDGTPG